MKTVRFVDAMKRLDWDAVGNALFNCIAVPAIVLAGMCCAIDDNATREGRARNAFVSSPDDRDDREECLQECAESDYSVRYCALACADSAEDAE